MWIVPVGGYRIKCAAAVAAAAAMGVVTPACAQLQIPNPLIRPHSLLNPASRDVSAESAAARVGPPPASTAAVPLNGGGVAAVDDPYARSLAEIKDRFSNYYVSAIVGKQAMLRRTSAGARTGSSAPGVPPPVGLTATPATAAGVAQYRSDTINLIDGELFDSVGNDGALVAKVGNRQVTIFHVQATSTAAGGRVIGKRAVVFAGDVENSGSAGVPLIVLERPDPAYKRMITVETRTRSASPSPADTANGNAAGANGSPAGATLPPGGSYQ